MAIASAPAPTFLRPGRPTSHREAAWTATVSVVALVAFVARLLPMLRGGGLGGSDGYDDSVYYAAATALVHGREPYADFVLLHPPGLILVLTPFASLARLTSDSVGQETARVAFMLLGAGNTVLVMRIARRFGTFAGVLAGLAYALCYPALYAERSTTLEALGTTVLLAALALLVRPGWAVVATPARVWAAGVALGAGSAVKIWGVLPLLVVAAWVLVTAGRRPASRLLLSAAATTAAICVPFFVQAPWQMLRYVVLGQVGRPRDGTSGMRRLTEMTGLQVMAHHVPGSWIDLAVLGVVASVGGAAILVCREPGARLISLLLLALALLALTSPSFYFHYATLTAAPAVLVVAIAAQHVLRRVAARGWPHLCALMSAAALLLVAAAGLPGVLHAQGTAFPSRVAAAGSGTRGCVTADDPTYLIAMNVLSRDLDAGCRMWVDVTGLAFDPAGGSTGYVHMSRNRTWGRQLVSYLLSGRATILARSTGALRPRDVARIHRLPVLASAGGIALHRVR